MALQATTGEEAILTTSLLLKPRVLACVAGAYVDGSEHCLSIEAACAVIRQTRSNACVIHVPRRLDQVPRQAIPIEALIDAYREPSEVVPLLNTSRARTAAEALDMIEYGRCAYRAIEELFSQPLLVKLEVLGSDLRSRDDEVMRVMEALPPELLGWVIPLVNASETGADEAASFNPPAVRLLVGRIGAGEGLLESRSTAAAIARLNGIPAIAEGGIASADHVFSAARCGAAAVLVNSAFHLSSQPAELAAQLRHAAQSVWP